jgi:hypothetical protein
MEKWSERTIQLANGVTQQVQLKSPTSNLVLVRNFDASNFVYMSTKPNISNSNYDNYVDVMGWGVVSKLGILDSVYLLSEADMSVLFVEATVKDPEQFVMSMIRSKTTAQEVKVTTSSLPSGAATAAKQDLIKSELNNINTKLADLTSINSKLADLASINSKLDLLNVQENGWNCKAIVATDSGLKKVKEGSGSVAAIYTNVNEEGEYTVQLKDGTDFPSAKWGVLTGGEVILFPKPIYCEGNIWLHFSAEGSAFVLYR